MFEIIMFIYLAFSWWEGVVIEKSKKDETSFTVHFPGMHDQVEQLLTTWIVICSVVKSIQPLF